MKTPVYFISDIHLKLKVDTYEKERRNKLYRLLDHILDTGGTCFFVGDLLISILSTLTWSPKLIWIFIKGHWK